MEGVTINSQILLPVVITLIVPLFIFLGRGEENRREAFSFIGAFLAFGSVVCMAPKVLAGQVLYYKVTTLLPGISIAFSADGLSMVFALISTFLWFLVTSYNIGYMRGLNEHAQTRYYICFAVAIFGAVGVALSANVFTLYLFYEIITVFTYPLVFHHEDEEGVKGARKYIVYLMGTSKLFLLPAMVLTYVLVGNLDFNLTDIQNGMFSADVIAEHPRLVALTYWLFIFGIGKAALMPFHNWLPSAMVAPTPVSALLHAVAVVKAGVFCVSRIVLSAFGTKTAATLTMSQVFVGAPGTWLGDLSLGMCTAYMGGIHPDRGLVHRPDQGRYQGTAGLLDRGPALIRHHRRDHAGGFGRAGRRHTHRPPCLLQDHTLYGGRRDLCGLPSEEDQPHERPGKEDAAHLRCVRYCLAVHDRHAAGLRFRIQMVSGQRYA